MHTSLNGWYSQFPVQYSTVLAICLHSRKIYFRSYKERSNMDEKERACTDSVRALSDLLFVYV